MRGTGGGQSQVRWILEIDGGFSHDPADALKFFEKMAAGYDCVFGTRLAAGGSFEDVSAKRRTISRLGTIATNALLGTRLTDMTSGYQLFTRKALQMVLKQGIRSKLIRTKPKLKSIVNLKCTGSDQLSSSESTIVECGGDGSRGEAGIARGIALVRKVVNKVS